jgi:O-antigen/teichoic acid export membrane protein
VAAAPILTRLYSGADFGVLATFAALVSILAIVPSLTFERAIPLPERDEDGAALLGLSLLLNLLFSLVLLAAGLAVGGAMAAAWPDLFHPLFVWLVPLGVLFIGGYQALNHWAIRHRNYRLVARTRVSQGAGQALFQVGLGFVMTGPIGLLLGHAAGQAAGIGSLALDAIRSAPAAMREITLKRMREQGSRYRRFATHYAPASLLNAAGLQIPALLFAGLYGVQVAGLYFLTQRVLGMPAQFLGTAVSQVVLGEGAVLLREDPQKLKRLTQRATSKMILISLPIAAILMLSGPPLFAFVFGEEWREAGRFVQWLVPAFIAKFAFESVVNLALIERHDIALGWGALRLLAVAGAIAGAAWAGLGPIYAVIFFSAAMTLTYLIKYALFMQAIPAPSSE